MPQPKKHNSTRARANKASTRATLSVVPTSAPEMPDAPAGYWHPLVEQWWQDVWLSPMSPEWHSSDFHNVVICAIHYHDMLTAETPGDRQKASAAYERSVKPLGLTPYDRRRLEWTIETAEEATERGQRRRESQPASRQPDSGDDPRLALVQ